MKGILFFVGTTAGSALGWWLGAFQSMTLALVLSTIGGVVGVWAAIRLGQEYLE